MYPREKIFLIVLFGVIFGLVIFGLQVSLTGFNDVIHPSEPSLFWSFEKITAGEYRIGALGRYFTVRFPEGEWVRQVKSLNFDLKNLWEL